jgi:hypothetical protein
MTSTPPTTATLQARIRQLEDDVAIRDAYIASLKSINEQMATELQHLREQIALDAYRAHYAAVAAAGTTA